MIGISTAISVGLNKAGSISSQYLLDIYPNAAVAYSLRKLRSNYSGPSIRVRRSPDNAEQDIGFDNNGVIDVGMLMAFIGAGNGFITTWYNQDGVGGNAVMLSTSFQPQIVLNGSIFTSNGKAAIKFNNSFLRALDSNGVSVNNTMATVQKSISIGSGKEVVMSIGNTSGSCYALLTWLDPQSSIGIYSQESQSLNGPQTINPEIWGSTTSVNLSKLWVNGDNKVITNPNYTYTSNLNDIQVGNDALGNAFNGFIQELIFWQTTKSDQDMLSINTNQNSYYSSY